MSQSATDGFQHAVNAVREPGHYGGLPNGTLNGTPFLTAASQRQQGTSTSATQLHAIGLSRFARTRANIAHGTMHGDAEQTIEPGTSIPHSS